MTQTPTEHHTIFGNRQRRRLPQEIDTLHLPIHPVSPVMASTVVACRRARGLQNHHPMYTHLHLDSRKYCVLHPLLPHTPCTPANESKYCGRKTSGNCLPGRKFQSPTLLDVWFRTTARDPYSSRARNARPAPTTARRHLDDPESQNSPNSDNIRGSRSS
jgi:hypothetical protein